MNYFQYGFTLQTNQIHHVTSLGLNMAELYFTWEESKLTKGTPRKPRRVWIWLGIPVHTQPKIADSHATFFWERLHVKN